MRAAWRVSAALLVIGATVSLAPGVASAHIPAITSSTRCVEGGGWQGSVTISFSEPGTTSGSVNASHPGLGGSWSALPANTSQTFGSGVTIPTSVSSVTFVVTGSWDDQFPIDESRTLTQPDGCAPPTTTTAPTTTTTTSTTVPVTTTTSPAGTTTTTPGATTTTVAGPLTIAAITPVCVRGAPYVQVGFGNQPELNGRTATITFVDNRGNVVGTHTATWSANTSARFIYPGATVDAVGNPTDWPGWRFDGDEWVPDTTDGYLRDGLTVRVEVNPSATGQVTYPAATSGCANPSGVRSTGGSAPLPNTGPTTRPTALAASIAVGLGLGALLLARRRSA